MLISFSVENFLSFKSKQSFSLQATVLKEHTSANTFLTDVSDLTLLKSAAIYGANASGKSCFFKAIKFVITFMRNSARDSQIGDSIGIVPFKLSSETIGKPSSFEIQLLVNGTAYRFGFTVNNEMIIKEYLYSRKKQKEYLLYERIGQTLNDEKFPEGKNMIERTRPNSLYLSTVSQFNGPISTSIIANLGQWTFMTDDVRTYINRTAQLLDSSSINPKIKNFILTYDLGFNDIKTTKKEVELKNFEPTSTSIFFSDRKILQIDIQTKHKIYNELNIPYEDTYFDLNEESEGTKKFFGIAGPLVQALSNGGVLIIDEFTSRLHPFIAEFIIKVIHSKSANPLNAQLVFISHSTFLLKPEIFRRDQVHFVKKEIQDYTTITPLSELDIRKDSSYEGKYFSENFGYTPHKRQNNQLNLFGDL